MRVMQMTIDQIVRMVTVRDSLMATARPMAVRCVMSAATMIGCTTVWIRGAYRKHVLIHMIFVRMMQMAIMQIVDVAIVTNSGVAAAGSVLMRVIRVNRMIVRSHGFSFPGERCRASMRGVIDGVPDETEHMSIGDPVTDILASASSNE
jgi:hypothetical protein